MPRFKEASSYKAQRRTDETLKALLTAYVDRNAATGTPAKRAHLDATQSVDDLAFHQPDQFWRFLEIAVASDVQLEDLKNLGWAPLTWLLRRYPDDYAERVAGAVRRDARMRDIADGIDQDRIAPDIWRRLRSATA